MLPHGNGLLVSRARIGGQGEQGHVPQRKQPRKHDRGHLANCYQYLGMSAWGPCASLQGQSILIVNSGIRIEKRN